MALADRNLIYAFAYPMRKEKWTKEIRIGELRLRERLHIYRQYKNKVSIISTWLKNILVSEWIGWINKSTLRILAV